MNETILERHNAVVGADDLVWVLGDVAMGSIAESLPFLRRFNGHKILIAGNHDRCFAGSMTDPRKRAKWVAAYKEQGGFDAIVTSSGYIAGTDRRDKCPVYIPLLGMTPVILSHFPASGESAPDREDRYRAARPVRPAKGEMPWIVHGHVHDAWCVDSANSQINVGVDVWDFAPVDAETVAALIETT